jgi:hypothetical protein
MVELYFHTAIHFYNMVFNYLRTGTTLHPCLTLVSVIPTRTNFDLFACFPLIIYFILSLDNYKNSYILINEFELCIRLEVT